MKLNNKYIFTALAFLLTTQTFSKIEINNDNMNFKTYGNSQGEFVSKFDYNYNDNKIIGKTVVKNFEDNYNVMFESLYTEKTLGKNNKIKFGILPLINEIDYFKLSDDLSILSDNKIKNYNGINLTTNKNIFNQQVFLNNIVGFYENKNENSYYENIIGSSLTIKNKFYKIRLGHSIIEPKIKEIDEYNNLKKGMLSSFEFNYRNKYFSHTNEFIKKSYSINNSVEMYTTRVDYLGINNLIKDSKFKIYSIYKTEKNNDFNGYKKITNGIEYNPIKDVILTSNYENKTKFFKSIDYNSENYFNIGLNFNY